MNKTTMILLFVFFFSYSLNAQLVVGENGNIEVKAGATLDVAGLEITPISDYNFSAGVTIQKSNTSIALPNGESMLRSYYMDQTLENLSATVVYNYEDADMNGITHNAKMVVDHDGGNTMEYEDSDDLDYQVTSEFQDPTTFAIVTAGDATLSVETLDGEMSISVFPNPTSSILNINFDGDLNLSIFNMLGQQVLETNSKQIDISGLETGTYILIVQNLESNNSTNFKIIKE
tara:strand:+ start:14958 stop:15653 length:696 start_codon:yes stop_codon:yes gene_type:complete